MKWLLGPIEGHEEAVVPVSHTSYVFTIDALKVYTISDPASTSFFIASP
jgi:hypothetical protein